MSDEGKDRGCSPALDQGGENGEGQGDTLQHLPQPETLAGFLKKFERHQIAPDTPLYKEGGPIEHIFYIASGKVEIRVADEALSVVRGPAVLGAEESHFRVSFPTYAYTAVAVTPTSVIWLDRHDLKTVYDLDPNCITAYMKLLAELKKATIERLARMRGRVSRLGEALEDTQNLILELHKPSTEDPLPEELLPRWRAQCETIEILLQQVRDRAEGVAKLREALQELAKKHPDWAKHPDFIAFVQSVEELEAQDPLKSEGHGTA